MRRIHLARQRLACPTYLHRSPKYLMLSLLIICSQGSLVRSSEDSDRKDNWLGNIQRSAEERSLLFFHLFGSYLNRNRFPDRLDCDYDDPEKMQYCPPVAPPPKHIRMVDDGTTRQKRGKQRRNVETLPTKCLDNPEDPDCRLLDQVNVHRSTLFTSAGRKWPTAAPIATQEPTRDDCYGNMLDGRFCSSEQPTISEEPTIIQQPKTELPVAGLSSAPGYRKEPLKPSLSLPPHPEPTRHEPYNNYGDITRPPKPGRPIPPHYNATANFTKEPTTKFSESVNITKVSTPVPGARDKGNVTRGTQPVSGPTPIPVLSYDIHGEVTRRPTAQKTPTIQPTIEFGGPASIPRGTDETPTVQPGTPSVQPTAPRPTQIDESIQAPASITRSPTVEPGKPSISPTTGQPTFVETFEAPAAVTRRPSWPIPQPKLCYPEVVIVEEDFEGAGSANSWTGGSLSRREDGSQFLGLLGQGNSEIYQEFEIPLSANEEDPTEANSVTVQFSLYLLDKWTPPDKVFVVVNGISVDLGELESTSTGEPAAGEAGGITWESIPPKRGISIMKNETNVEKQHTILLTIPNDVMDNSKMTLSFQASTSKPISEESAGIDDLVITGFYECEESAAPSVPTVPTTAGPTMVATFEAPAAVTRMPTVEPGKPSISPTTGQPTFVETFEAPAAVTRRPSWPISQPKLCYPEVVIVEENFESAGSANSWTGGSLSRREDGSQFLGLLGQGNSEIYQEFEIPLSQMKKIQRGKLCNRSVFFVSLDKWTPPTRCLWWSMASVWTLEIWRAPALGAALEKRRHYLGEIPPNVASAS
ncbi:expressed unknown protein [Seminavis robusta]|uniref:Uncharacterized protein n=1 Tax=Seminavis robusta TaxID=568900 RepID=A0A9N8H6Q6_9STRA|nr:expressed unknown protein [Seminavis robusta]|eukprot:Sro119_g057990.1 n/a (813) ;mRNA; r:34987-37550